MRGRAFGFVVILCATWVAARMGFAVMADEQTPVGKNHFVSAETKSGAVPKSLPVKTDHKESALRQALAKKVRIDRRTTILLPAAPHKLSAFAKPTDEQADKNSIEIVPSIVVEPFRFESPRKDQRPRPIQIYAYSFWRPGDAAVGVLGNGQYGGGQSAMLMTIPLLRFPNRRGGARLALTGRASVSHDRPRERELAAGLRWRPSAAFPGQFSLEQRFRPNRPDALAAFVSGGYDGTLPLGLSLNSYGQAGIVTGDTGGVFADVQLHALKPVVAQSRSTLAAGAGVWGGGQSQIVRLDIGPSARAHFVAGSTQLRLDASWRFRIAGDARPGNGPALTLSTSF